IAVMEAVVQPMQWSDASFPERYLFRKFRDPADGHAIIAEDNYFVERLLPMMSGRRLTEVEMNAYRQPFPTVESRRPIAQWPREIPISGQPKRNVERIGHNYAWLRDKSNTPLLLVHAEPGVIFKAEAVKAMRNDISRMQTVSVGSGLHYIQEVQPTRIGDVVAEWFHTIESQPLSKARP
ncbi:MAG: haloalkane dehalogenase, partial [Planctomycetota bacterium]